MVTTFTFPVAHFAHPSKLCITVILNFQRHVSNGSKCNTQEELETKVIRKFGEISEGKGQIFQIQLDYDTFQIMGTSNNMY